MKNEPAFPNAARTEEHFKGHAHIAQIPANDGMTLRDYLAAKVMQAMIANPYTGEKFHKENVGKDEQETSIARNAYKMADAMLQERSKTT
jgi:hypothetical protein